MLSIGGRLQNVPQPHALGGHTIIEPGEFARSKALLRIHAQFVASHLSRSAAWWKAFLPRETLGASYKYDITYILINYMTYIIRLAIEKIIIKLGNFTMLFRGGPC